MSEKVKKEKKPSIFKRIGNFFKEVKVETLKRIIWPTPKQVVNNTVIVLVTVVVVFILVAVIDLIFTSGLNFLVNDLPTMIGSK